MSDCSTNAFSLPEAPLEYADALQRENAALRALLADALRVLAQCASIDTWRTEDSCEGCRHYAGTCCARFDISTDAYALGVR